MPENAGSFAIMKHGIEPENADLRELTNRLAAKTDVLSALKRGTSRATGDLFHYFRIFTVGIEIRYHLFLVTFFISVILFRSEAKALSRTGLPPAARKTFLRGTAWSELRDKEYKGKLSYIIAIPRVILPDQFSFFGIPTTATTPAQKEGSQAEYMSFHHLQAEATL
ncbi:hypothetical protein EDC04DRAFT_2598086 [Pisolithus marmoratus]|nr:hypothetical protein EDC04DRAFT_2598086 [Pisolithus marmoratus]